MTTSIMLRCFVSFIEMLLIFYHRAHVPGFELSLSKKKLNISFLGSPSVQHEWLICHADVKGGWVYNYFFPKELWIDHYLNKLSRNTILYTFKLKLKISAEILKSCQTKRRLDPGVALEWRGRPGRDQSG